MGTFYGVLRIREIKLVFRVKNKYSYIETMESFPFLNVEFP